MPGLPMRNEQRADRLSSRNTSCSGLVTDSHCWLSYFAFTVLLTACAWSIVISGSIHFLICCVECVCSIRKTLPQSSREIGKKRERLCGATQRRGFDSPADQISSNRSLACRRLSLPENPVDP